MDMTSRLKGTLDFYCVSQTQLAEVLGLTPMRINQLIDEGIVIRDPTSRTGEVMLIESLRNFYLSRKTTDDGKGVNYWKEKALHEQINRKRDELKLAQESGELYEAATIERVLTEHYTDFKNKLLGVGHKLAPRIEDLNAAQISDIIDSEIEIILEELSQVVDEKTYEEENPGTSDGTTAEVGNTGGGDSKVGN